MLCAAAARDEHHPPPTIRKTSSTSPARTRADAYAVFGTTSPFIATATSRGSI